MHLELHAGNGQSRDGRDLSQSGATSLETSARQVRYCFTEPTGAPFKWVGRRRPAGPEFRLGSSSSAAAAVPILIDRIPASSDAGRSPTGVEGCNGVEKDLVPG